MDTLLDTDGPVIFKIDGQDVSIPKATNRDYIPWLAEIHKERSETDAKLVPATLPPAEKHKLLVQISRNRPTQWDIAPLLNTPEGIDRLLRMVSEKLPPELQAKIAALPQSRGFELAARASGLFPASKLAAMFEPPLEELEQYAINLLHPFWRAMKVKGVADDVARAILLQLPGVTAEMIDGKPATPEAPKPQTFGGAPGNG